MIRTHLLWNDIIESDGHVHHEETFLGAFLAFTALAVLIGIVAFLFL